jgi:cell division septation protein DedD
MDTLRVVIREIKDYVIEASFRSKEEQEQSMFRVLLKPVGSKREAKALTKQLVSKNIRDYYIITEGSYENGISLGYFSSKGRAERHGNRVRKAGFDAIVEPVFKTYTIYWLDYRIKAGHQIPPQIFEKHLDSTTQRLSRGCD